ncbi:sulfite exporter TauE/SafE family protein [Cohnella algarum]|uniref:urease accessory protein UreH domain-containing protein n=1 Tax=Cohnella algarum TaxID=2044859 RepID=UPI001967EA53|nr:sulfite exporter TauE/SafE family protein [Cohnella algarum]MBN2981771.1 sulfite exporter TauE/SafE family protein [Cohnella algarum]
MYAFFSEISRWLSSPFADIAINSQIAFLAALFFGFAGSVAPCQLTANLGSITYFGNKYMNEKLPGLEFILYLLGKMAVYSTFGLLFWLFGQSASVESIPVFVFARKLIGPLFILMGLFFLGIIKLRRLSFGFKLASSVQRMSERAGGKWGAFLMGVAFSLGFCPTMVLLFFGWMMPVAIQSSYGFILPSVFAVGTAFPLLLFFGIVIGFGLDRTIVKKARQWGRVIYRVSGVFLIVLGISDTITYWAI